MTVRHAGVGIGCVVLLGVVLFVWPLPAAWFESHEHVRIMDRSGQLLAERPVPARGHELWVDLEDVSPAVVDALLASEDERFHDHLGIDPWAIGRAARANAAAGVVVQGGSTLTQQTVRLLAGRHRGWVGKLVEAWRALRLELHRDKAEILTWYLNRAYFGGGATGIEAAARATFDESAASLSLSEAATLVGLLPSPSRRHPRRDRAAALAARDRVLGRMLQVGRITDEAAALALAEPLQLRRRRVEGLAPHFVARVLDEPHRSGPVRTTLDADLQRDVEQLVAEQLAALSGREVDHAAVLVLHVPTSEVRAYVGSGAFEVDDGQVDGVRARRSPGSALKPFLYGLAFEGRWRPADVVDDAPRRYATRHGSWAPVNYDGGFRGPVRLREALAGSYNIPAVMLLEDVGVASLQSRLGAIGIALPEPAPHYGLGLALGDADVSLEDLTAAYAGLARGGTWERPTHLQQHAPGDPVRFLSAEAAFLVADVLSDPVARVPAFGRRTPLSRSYPASVKTGTSTNYRDNWTVGFTSEWAVGVWVGNFDGRPMGDVSGVTGAGPLWGAVLDRAVSGGAGPAASPRAPVPPPTLARFDTCTRTGGAATEACVHTVQDWALADAGPREPCPLHGPRGASARRPGARIHYPAPETVLYVDPRLPPDAQRVPLRAEVMPDARHVTWFANGRPVGSGPPDQPVLWQPAGVGPWRIALQVDGREEGEVQVEVRGAPGTE